MASEQYRHVSQIFANYTAPYLSNGSSPHRDAIFLLRPCSSRMLIATQVATTDPKDRRCLFSFYPFKGETQ
jgi:hypothetical protein